MNQAPTTDATNVGTAAGIRHPVKPSAGGRKTTNATRATGSAHRNCGVAGRVRSAGANSQEEPPGEGTRPYGSGTEGGGAASAARQDLRGRGVAARAVASRSSFP